MTRLKCTSRGLALLAAVGLLQGGAALAQTDPTVPAVPQTPAVDVLPQPTSPPGDQAIPAVPQTPPAPPVSTDPVYQPIPGLPTYSTPSTPTYSSNKEIPVYVPYSARSGVNPKDKTKGENQLEAYYAPKYPTTLPLYGTRGPSWGPGGHVASGLRVGQPYYWSRSGYPGNAGSGDAAAYGYEAQAGYYGTGAPGYGPPASGTPSNVVPTAGCNCRNGSAGAMAAPGPPAASAPSRPRARSSCGPTPT